MNKVCNTCEERVKVVEPDWSKAYCAGSGTHLFFPKSGGVWGPNDKKKVMEYCDNCSIRQECGDFATGAGLEYGYWGGTSRAERKHRRGVSKAANR